MDDLTGALQAQIDLALADLGLSAGDITVSLNLGSIRFAANTSAAQALIIKPFSVFSFDIPSGRLDLDFSFARSVEENRPFAFSLADAGLPPVFSDLVGVSTAGNLGIEAGFDLQVGLSLDFDVDESGPAAGFFLRTADTGLNAYARAFGNDLEFDAQLGPLGIFVKEGMAALDLEFELGLANPDGDGRLDLIELSGSELGSDIGRIGEFIVIDDLTPGGTDTVFLTATGSASLPLFFGSGIEPGPTRNPEHPGHQYRFQETGTG